MNRVGEKRLMNDGKEAEIIKYNGVRNIVVRFLETKEEVICQYSNFKNGRVKSHFTPTVYGVGIVGGDKITDDNGKIKREYNTWQHMLKRCYSDEFKKKRKTYKDCTVCDEWLYYPSFKKWYNENYYEVNNEKMCLDKDILNKGNKIYSPETCVFVPERINTLFIKKNANRGGCPIGVSWHKRDKKYISRCNVLDLKRKLVTIKHLGYYNTPEEAFNAYKIAKEDNIKQVADYYKDQIPQKLYEAMYRYEVEVTD